MAAYTHLIYINTRVLTSMRVYLYIYIGILGLFLPNSSNGILYRY